MSESNSRKFSKGEIGQLITGDVDFTSATVRGHIIPDTNDAYDIGSAEYKVRDMYVSDNSLWVGDDVKIGSSGGKKKNSKRKQGKTPKKIYDAMIGAGKLFATETDLKNKFKLDIHDPSPDPTLDPDHADFHPAIRKWLEFSAINGQGGFKRPDDIFDNDDDFESEDGIDAVDGLQTALDAKLNATAAYVLPNATDSILGGFKVGANLSISNGVLAGAAPYSKPSAEPISYITGLQTALDAKTTPAYVDTQVAALVDSAPATLDTLNELAAALGDDANHTATMTALIGTKQSATADYDVGDNIKIKLGTGDDLQLWHDGNNSYIKDHDAGNLFIQGSTTVTIEDTGGNNMAVFNDGASVDLYHGATSRFSTTSTGIDVTGTCAATAFTGDGSGLSNVDPFPSGTKMIFNQASAPTGWTKSTTHNDKVLRVVSGTGGGSGGTHALTSPPSTSHNHSTSAHNHGHSLSAGAHTLSTSQMPAHTHSYMTYSGGFGGSSGFHRLGHTSQSWIESTQTGSSTSHSHSLSGSISSGGGAATGAAGPSVFVPQFIDVIVCSKD